MDGMKLLLHGMHTEYGAPDLLVSRLLRLSVGSVDLFCLGVVY